MILSTSGVEWRKHESLNTMTGKVKKYFPAGIHPSTSAYLTMCLSDFIQSKWAAAAESVSDGSDGGFVLHNDLIEVVNTLRIMRASRPQQTQEWELWNGAARAHTRTHTRAEEISVDY